jgi:hypothetical protein
MGLVMGFTAVIVGIVAALAGLVLWTALIFPGPAERARLALEGRPGRCFVTGLLVALLIGGPFVVLLQSPNGLAKIGGWLAAVPLLGALVLGLSAMARLLGDRLRSLSPAVTELGGLVRGALILELAMLLPVFGWFLFAPLVGLTLVGAGLLGAMPERREGSSPSRVSGRNSGTSSVSIMAEDLLLPRAPAQE